MGDGGREGGLRAEEASVIYKLLMTFLRGFSWTLGRLAAQRLVRRKVQRPRIVRPLCQDDSHADSWTCAKCRGEAPTGTCECFAGLYCERCRAQVLSVGVIEPGR